VSFGDTLTDAITPWIHIIAITIWVGPQFMMFFAAIPAIRTIEERQVRARVMRTIVTRYGWLAWAAMLVIILSGISNIFQVQDIDPTVDIGSSDIRWFHWFSGKMVLVAAMIVLTAVHTFIIGPRQLDLSERDDADEAELSRLRRVSVALSGVVLLLSIAVILFGLILSDHGYTFQER
jgi:uncharacterized membrane protein